MNARRLGLHVLKNIQSGHRHHFHGSETSATATLDGIGLEPAISTAIGGTSLGQTQPESCTVAPHVLCSLVCARDRSPSSGTRTTTGGKNKMCTKGNGRIIKSMPTCFVCLFVCIPRSNPRPSFSGSRNDE